MFRLPCLVTFIWISPTALRSGEDFTNELLEVYIAGVTHLVSCLIASHK